MDLPIANLQWFCVCSRGCGWAVRLLRRIHFCQVNKWELEGVLRRADQQLSRLVLAEALRQSRHRPQSHTALIPSPLVNNRGMELAVVKVNKFRVVIYITIVIQFWNNLKKLILIVDLKCWIFLLVFPIAD